MNPPSKERELFGTLLASTPARTRSWRSFGIALGIHGAFLAVLIITFKPFQNRESEEETAPINMIMVDEDDAVATLPNPFVRAIPAPVVVAAPRPTEEQLILPRGPLTPIVIDSRAPASTEVTTEPTGRRGTAAPLSERLLPTYIDPRVATTTAFPPAEKTPAEVVRARISDRLTRWNDSIAAEIALDAKEDDWTLKGKDGKRWGVTNDTIYIGNFKMSTKRIAFQPPPGRREEIAGRLRDFNEIEQQAYLEESRSSFKERVKTIRERKDRERAEKKKKAEEKPITESR